MSQETIHYSYRNHVTRVDVEGRGGYRYETIHYSSHNQGERGRLFNSPVSFCSAEEGINEKEIGDISSDHYDGRYYKSRENGDSRLDIIFDDGRRGSRSKETIHF